MVVWTNFLINGEHSCLLAPALYTPRYAIAHHAVATRFLWWNEYWEQTCNDQSTNGQLARCQSLCWPEGRYSPMKRHNDRNLQMDKAIKYLHAILHSL